MRLDFSGERILAVVAHPDDAEILCAGTLARARSDGAQVGIAVLCRGDKGQPSQLIPHLASVRQVEMERAAEHQGAWLARGEIPDGTLMDDAANRAMVVDIFRGFRPTLVLAHSDRDYHPDHRGAEKLAFAASWLSASQGYVTEMTPLGSSPAFWHMDTLGMMDFEPSIYVDISKHLGLKEKLLSLHASQIGRRGERDFAPLLDLMHNQAQARGMQAGVAAAEAFCARSLFKRCRAF